MPEQGEFSGRTVLVTGAGGGIGAATARAFADHGATLVLNDLRAPGGEEAPGVWVVGDLRDPQVVRDLIATARERTGRIDVLVNAAGIQLRKPAVDVEEEEWQTLLGVNLSAAYALARAAAPALIEHKGAIINITSLSATRVLPNIVPYGATKAALTQLSNGLAAELGPSGVRVNAVAPGHIITPMTEQNLARPDVSGRLLPRIPLGHFGTADEVAEAVMFLASQRARYITGTVLAVDGGYAVT
jgi:2-deoxy-D-gluconate 3-dehydrogenase